MTGCNLLNNTVCTFFWSLYCCQKIGPGYQVQDIRKTSRNTKLQCFSSEHTPLQHRLGHKLGVKEGVFRLLGLKLGKEQRNLHSGELNYILTFDASLYLVTRFHCFPCGFSSGGIFYMLSDCQVRLCLWWNRDVVPVKSALDQAWKGTTVCRSSELSEQILKFDVGRIYPLLPSPEQATHTGGRASEKAGLDIIYHDASDIWGRILLSSF